MDYPIREFAMGGGILIALVAILHVVVSHFAVGGGLVLAVLETAAVKRNDRPLRDLVKRSSMILLLLSTVFGAISGVGIWFTIGVVHPAATSSLIHTFVWAWATEWTFFLLEVVTALAWVATWGKVSPRTHLLLIWLYAFAAFMSLVVIQGILGFMLTPGSYPKTFSFWDGFLNPTYLPGILFRTGVCILLAAAWMAFAALREPDRDARARLSRILGAAGALGIGVAGSAGSSGSGRSRNRSSASSSARSPFSPLSRRAGRIRSGCSPSPRCSPSSSSSCRSSSRGRLRSSPSSPAPGSSPATRGSARESASRSVIAEQMFSNGVLVSEIDALNEKGILSKAVWATKEAGGRARASRRSRLPRTVRLLSHAGRLPRNPEDRLRHGRRVRRDVPDGDAGRRRELEGPRRGKGREARLRVHASVRRDRRGARGARPVARLAERGRRWRR